MQKRNQEPFNLRLPKGWREKIKEAAKEDRRSMNSEINIAIQKGMAAKGIELEHP